MISSHLLGFDKVRKELEKREKALSDQPQKIKAMRKALKTIATRASQLAPVRSGKLRKNIIVAPVPGESKDEVAVGVGVRKKKAWYGHFVEFGYGDQKPQPFLRPAVNEKSNQANEILSDELTKILDL